MIKVRDSKLRESELKNALQTRIEGIIAETISKYIKNQDFDGTIYHYTDLQGLIGIIEKQSIFATNSSFLNDKQEFHHGVQIFKEQAQNILNSGTNKDFLEFFIANISSIKTTNQYVACFSKNGDLLSQWRAYAKNGCGISIGFNAEILNKEFEPLADGFSVIYEKDLQDRIATDLFNKCIAFLKTLPNVHWNEDDLDSHLTTSIIIDSLLKTVIPQFKDNSFIEEKEYRYSLIFDELINPERDIQFRIRGNYMLPYMDIKTKNKELLPIEKIIIGPSVDYDVIREALNLFLYKHDYKYVNIEKSRIPYRI